MSNHHDHRIDRSGPDPQTEDRYLAALSPQPTGPATTPEPTGSRVHDLLEKAHQWETLDGNADWSVAQLALLLSDARSDVVALAALVRHLSGGSEQLSFPGIDEIELAPTPAQARAGKIHIDQCGYCGLLVSAPDTRGHRADAKLGPCPRCECPSWWRQCSDVAEVATGRHIVGPFHRSAQ